MNIIKDKVIVEDSWQHVPPDAALPDGDIILTLEAWQEKREELTGRNSRVGIKLEPGVDLSDIKDFLEDIDLIAINFPTFGDGRGYSHAKILRDRYGFAGEIRAVGDVLQDQIFYLQRCGFNSYEVRVDRNMTEALDAFDDFTVIYQVSADEKLPLYRRK